MKDAKVIPFWAQDPASLGLTDEALLAACAAGDPGGLAGLYDRHVDALVRFLSRMAHVDEQDVEDFVHDVFVEAYRHAGRFRHRSSVRTWLFAIAANLAKDRARTSRRHRELGEAIRHDSARADRGPEAQAAERQALERLQDGLARLSHDQRVVFVMCDLEEIPGVEAARALGMPSGTLYRLLFEARRALRVAIEGGAG